MGLIDRFRKSRPPAKTPRGNSGRGHVDGYLQLDELNHDLTFPNGLQVFDKMYRSDPDVRKNLWMFINLFIGATWTVEPYGKDEATQQDLDAAELVRWALFENMQPGFKGHLEQVLPLLFRSGFTPAEPIWETTEYQGRKVIVPATLGIRLPRTFVRFEQENDQLTHLHQQLLSGTVTYPADDILYYRIGAEGDNWEGTSLLRAAYKPWFIKEKIEKLDAIKVEREAMGIPVYYPPDNANEDQKNAMDEILANVRSGEQGWIRMPGPKAELMEDAQAQSNGWTLEMLGVKQSETADTRKSLDYHSDKIAAVLLAEFMRLGQGSSPGGSRAVGDVQQNPFLQAAEAVSAPIEAVINNGLVARLTDLNLEVDGPPKLVMSLVDSDLEQLGTVLAQLVEKGLIHPDDDTEDFLRDRMDLPPADPAAREERKAASEAARERLLQTDPDPTGKSVPIKNDPSQPPVKPTGPELPGKKLAPTPIPNDRPDDKPVPVDKPRWGRELRPWEELMCLEQLDTAIVGARDRFQAAGRDETHRLVGEFVKAAQKGATSMPKFSTGLQDVLYRELQSLFLTGQATVEQELEAQRPTPSKVTPGRVFEDANTTDLKRRASLAAFAIATRIWQAVSRYGLLTHPDQAVLLADEAGAHEAGEKEAAAGLKAEAQAHASGALNSGRQAAADQHASEIRGARYTSILDSSRCDACRLADDDVLRKLTDPIRLKRRPPNPDCYGGGACRCMEFYELTDEASGGGGGEPEPPPEPQPIGGGGDAAKHFDITGTDSKTGQIVDDQLAAIDKVHSMPSGLPRVSMNVKPLSPDGRLGRWAAKRFDPYEGRWVDEKIDINRNALLRDPSLPSVVHETAHHMDLNGMGNGVTVQQVSASTFTSSLPETAGWRTAVMNTPTIDRMKQRLVAATEMSEIRRLEYLTKVEEVFARSYEQWIALRSGNATLRRKIEARNSSEPGTYWPSAEFGPVADAFDDYFAAKGLLKSRG